MRAVRVVARAACGTLDPMAEKRRALKRLLVANRGEIALRIIRSARLLGLKTIAVYSEADAGCAHVAAADDARLIGPVEAAKSYLNVDAIIAAAKASRADAIHPGYGFLSERPEFARAVAKHRMVFVGPPADVMAAVGDKLAARRIAQKTRVPVIPGAEIDDPKRARAFARRAGFPILVKASAGGGGRGMRLVEKAAQLEPALEAAAREAKAAFGDGRIFVEKYLARPRHVEVQVMGDGRGNVIALGERECSIQRRHQKIIEESPASGISRGVREKMTDAALRLARAAKYRSAGTVEFLVEADNFYFLEVNARLQVEHPVTEMRFGCDLVAEQLRIAAGGKLGHPGEPRGAAIECRIYAEDAIHDFRPATGKVVYLSLPSGPGVRVDTHLGPNAEVSPYYDGLVAKVVCHGEDREQARRRMVLALDEFALLGVTNTAAFLRDVVNSAPFRRADLSTRFVSEFFSGWGPNEESLDGALIAAALVADGAIGGDQTDSKLAPAARGRGSPWDDLKGFELFGRR